MFKSKLYLSAMIISALSVSAVGTSFAQPMDMPPPPPPYKAGMLGPEAGPLGMIFRGIQLTDTQKEQIRQILDKARTVEEQNRQQMHDVHEKIANMLLSNEVVTEDTLKPVLEEQSNLENTVKTNHIRTLLAVRAVLTPAQLVTAKDRYKQLKSIRGEMKELQMKLHDLNDKPAPPPPSPPPAAS